LISFSSQRLLGDYDVISKVIERGPPLLLKKFSMDLRAQRDLMLRAVAVDGEALQFVSDTLKNDREVVLTAVGANHQGVKALK
jgi:hypothetical protein